MKLAYVALLTWTCFGMPLWALPLSHDQSAITTKHSLERRGTTASKACKNGACLATGAVNAAKNHANKIHENRLLKQEASLKLKQEQAKEFQGKYPLLYQQNKRRQEDRRQIKNGAIGNAIAAVGVAGAYAGYDYMRENDIHGKVSNWAKDSFQGANTSPAKESVQVAKTNPLPQSNKEGNKPAAN